MISQDTASALPATEHKARIECMRVLYEQPLSAVLGNLVVAAILCWTLWPVVDPQRLIGWMVMHVLVAVPRTWNLLAFRRASPMAQDSLRWMRLYSITLLATVSVWGLGVLVVMPASSLAHQCMVLLFVAGMMGSVVWSFAANFALALTSIYVLLVPVTVWMVVQGGREWVPLVILFVMALISVRRGLRAYSEVMVSRIRLAHELEHARQQADRMAMTDELTQINNRRAFLQRAEQMACFAQRQGTELCVIMFDIDHFKLINDTHGHAMGDEVLRRTGALLQRSCRSSDVAGRLGGEEFALALPDSSLHDAHRIALALKAGLENLACDTVDGVRLNIAASFGLARVSACAYDLLATLNQADKALYAAKRAGRNQVVVAE